MKILNPVVVFQLASLTGSENECQMKMNRQSCACFMRVASVSWNIIFFCKYWMKYMEDICLRSIPIDPDDMC